MQSAAMFQTILLVFALSTNSLPVGRNISVNNGQAWGQWSYMERCPPGSQAGGFSIRVEGRQVGGDDTAVNGIRLHCMKPEGSNGTVTSNAGDWGDWQETLWCRGKMIAFQLNVEQHQGAGDDTAVNDINFKCENNIVVHGRSGLSWGDWGNWSNECTTGICGIKTSVEPQQGGGDDTSLNDVQFQCCEEMALTYNTSKAIC